ncbi:hypothetical protein KAW55_04225 [bacterium]|nr:hypothetical protein [bacterium]
MPVKIPIVASIVMLLLAIPPGWPYGYYSLLRLVVCGTSVYLVWSARQINKDGWMWAMGFVALLFNPILPIHLDKFTWSVIDLGIAILFVISIFKLKVA